MEQIVSLPIEEGVWRGVTVYVPHSIGRNPLFVFCADGRGVSLLGGNLDECASASGVVLVGVHSKPTTRGQEYVEGRDERLFRQHEQFFTGTVRDWVAAEFSVQLTAANTAVCGYSCGGAFAISMGLRHPNLFGSIIAMAIAGRPVRVDKSPSCSVDLSHQRYYLAAGESEISAMKKYMRRLAKWIAECGGSSQYHESPGAHEFPVWQYELERGLEWLQVRPNRMSEYS